MATGTTQRCSGSHIVLMLSVQCCAQTTAVIASAAASNAVRAAHACSKQMKITSAFGAFLDPVADKIMCAGCQKRWHPAAAAKRLQCRGCSAAQALVTCPILRRVSTALVLLATAPPTPISSFGMAIPVCLMIGR